MAKHGQKKEKLGMPLTQCSLWMIDCWSIHKSEEFHTWMKTAHPTIIILATVLGSGNHLILVFKES
jgi:hypothetical protein